MPDFDAWVEFVFGVNPSHFQPAADLTAPGTIRPVVNGQGQPAAAASPTIKLDPALQNWSVLNNPVQAALVVAAERVVMPGPAQQAQSRIRPAIADITIAIQAGNIAKANQRYAQATADAKIVTAAPDAAMGPVTPSQHPDQVVMGEAQHIEASADPKNAAAHTRDLTPAFAQQNQVGDCYLISVLGDVAKLHPEIISNMVHDNRNGTYTVTFHQGKTGLSGIWASITGGEQFEPAKVTVDGNFGSNIVNTANEAPGPGNKKEIWAQVVEKAYAKLHGGYDQINHGGWPKDAMQAVTGKAATQKLAASVTLADLQADLAKKKLIVMDTKAPSTTQPLPLNMVGPHAYTLESIDPGPNGPILHLRNPWGSGDVFLPFKQFTQGVAQVETGDVP